MEISVIGENNIATFCPNCDEPIMCKGTTVIYTLSRLLDEHLALNPACREFYDALPTLNNMRGILQEAI